ncbi:uncharacterized protein MONOS_17013 [Monocercomonoides exilis]|uniref:uncharacterized protein n=1 Tax=Monocercomonoides exilis TaxID=2049356 RepID=UPI00355A8A06|nr:hypothetical protein MONOS_17013 [Monocercomonoides exilis]
MINLFHFPSLLYIFVLFVCTCTYLSQSYKQVFVKHKKGFGGIFYKATVLGDRCSPFISVLAILMAAYTLFIKE